MTDEVRDMIVESAATFFTRFGFKHTTMENFAECIHKAKGLLRLRLRNPYPSSLINVETRKKKWYIFV